MLFKEFKDKVDNSFQQMCKGQSNLFRAKVDKDLLWNTYLESFPEERDKNIIVIVVDNLLRIGQCSSY